MKSEPLEHFEPPRSEDRFASSFPHSRVESSVPSPNGVPDQEHLTIRPPTDEWTIIKVTSLGHFLCHLGELIFPSVMVAVMAEFDLAPHLATALALLGYILLGVGALPVGLWVDAWDPKRILLIYFVAMTGAGLAVALAPGVWALFAALTLLGLAASIYHPTGLAMISLDVSQRGRALGINGVAGSLGIALAPILGSGASYLGMWRLAYGILAGLAALATAVMIVNLRKFPDSPRSRAKEAVPGMQDPPSSSGSLALVILLLVMMLAGFNYRCLMMALPTFLSGEHAAGRQLIQGGVFTALVLLAGGGLGQVFGGVLSDRFGARRIYLGLIGSMIPLSLLLGVQTGMVLAAALAGILSVSLFAQQPVENSLLAECTSRNRRSVSYGIKFVLTFGVGALGAQVVGIIWEECDSLYPVFYLIAGSATIMAGLVVVFRWQTRVLENMPVLESRFL